MSTTLAAPRLEVAVSTSVTTARCQAGDGGVAVAVATATGQRLLVAAEAGRFALMLAHAFRRAAATPVSLTLVADLLDDTLRRVGQASVCATLVDITPGRISVLHRGGPAPIVIHSDRSLTRVQAHLPGPPLASGVGGRSPGVAESLKTGVGDVLLVTTPGAVEPSLRAIASAADPTLPSLWRALRDDGPLDAGSAYALV